MSSFVSPWPRSRRPVGSVVAFLFLMMSEASAGQAQPAATGQPAPAPPATGCAALLPKVDAAAASSPTGIRRRRALLVGISKYAELGSKNGMWKSLPTGCDVELIRQVLLARFGFRDEDIRTLTEGQATKANIEQAFREHLIEGAGPRDVAVFYYSGHGQPVADPEAFGGLRGSLVTANYTTGRGSVEAREDNLRSDEIRDLLRALKEKMKDDHGKVDGNITVLFDSCYSGGATKGDFQEKGRPWDPAVDGPIPQPKPGMGNKGEFGTKGLGDFDRDAAIAEGYVFISACRNYQVAYCPQRDTEASVFTYHLAQRLAKATPETTYRDLFEPLCGDITSSQVPQLEGDSTKKLLAGAAVPGERYLVVQAVDGKRVTLPVGFVQGITGGTRYALYRAGTRVSEAKNQLGEAKVVDVGTTSCVAELEGPGAAGLKPEDLKAARAVELERAFGANPLYVLFEGVDRPDTLLKPYAVIASKDEGGRPVTRATYHVRVRPAGTLDPATGREILVDPKTGARRLSPADGEPVPQNNMIWVQAREGEVLDEFPADQDAPMAIFNTLFNEWQARYLAQYLKRPYDPTQAINVKLLVEAVTVKKDLKTGKTEIEVRKDVNTDGEMRLHEGDRIRFSVQNASTVPVFVTVVLINRAGVQPVFPLDSGVNFQLMPSTSPSLLPGFVYRMTKPYGTDLYKVIVTKDPANFSGLLFRHRLPPGVLDRGPADAKDAEAIAKLPTQVHPLALLLRKAVDGTNKKGERELIGTEWATAEKEVEVLPPAGQ